MSASALYSLSFEFNQLSMNSWSLAWSADLALVVIPSSCASIPSFDSGLSAVHSPFKFCSDGGGGVIYCHVFRDQQYLGVIANRRLAFSGVVNFRDLGGYRGFEGRHVTAGKLYRSSHLAGLTPEDLALWDSLNIHQVVDFRSSREQERNVSFFPSAVKNIASLPVGAGNTSKLIAEISSGGMSAKKFHSVLAEINRFFVLEQLEHVRTFFDLLLNATGGVLFHCSAGKDRTGFAAAVTLLALGVSKEQILEDYMLTQRYFIPEEQYQWLSISSDIVLDLETVRPVLEVKSVYINAAFNAMDEAWGSGEAYLRDGVGLGDRELAQLRDCFLVA